MIVPRSEPGTESGGAATTRQIDLGDVRLVADEAGASDDVILLVHGHPFNRSMWRPQVEMLVRAGWRVLVPDLRGYGDSQVIPGITTLDVFARDLIPLIDRTGADRAVVAGLSMGGQIVMELARTYPERLRAVVLAATTPDPETVEGRRRRYEMADRLVREGMDPYAHEVLSRMLSARSIERLPHVARHVLSMMCATPVEGAAAALRGRAERPDYRPVLTSLHVPALIVVGDEDAFTTREDAERMQALVDESELCWMNGVGHLPNLEDAEAFNAALAGFLQRVKQGSAARLA
jgi:pimeloyl-ACP methyl ester carboxylesterase